MSYQTLSTATNMRAGLRRDNLIIATTCSLAVVLTILLGVSVAYQHDKMTNTNSSVFTVLRSLDRPPQAELIDAKPVPAEFISQSTILRIEDEKFELYFPNTWEVKENYMETKVMGLSPVVDEEDTFRENINVTTENLIGKQTLSNYKKAVQSSLKKSMPGIELIETDDDVQLGNRKAYSHVFQDYTTTQPYKFKQYYFISNSRAYALTFTAETDTYDEYLPIAEQIASTFRLI